MKKLAAIFLSILFASTASAQVISNATTNARMDGMGVSNAQIEDDFNIFINPAQLSNYKNGVYGELGTDPCSAGGNCGDAVNGSSVNGRNNNAFGGLHIDASYGGWGLYIGRPYSGPLSNMNQALSDGGAPNFSEPAANRFDLFYATHGMPLGFYLSYAKLSTTDKTGAVTTKDNATEINVGVGGLLMNGMLDAALNIGLPSFKLSDGLGNTVKSDASPNLSLLARHHNPMGGNSKLLTTLVIQLGDASVKGTGGSKVESTSTDISLNAALNSRPNADTLLVAGIGIASSDSEEKFKPGSDKVTRSSLSLPLNVGLEHQTFKKVQSRIGIQKDLYNNSSCKDTTASPGICSVLGSNKVKTISDGNATVSMGLGWAVAENLMVDAVINQDVLFTGSYAISGIPETLNSKLSATYRFK